MTRALLLGLAGTLIAGAALAGEVTVVVDGVDSTEGTLRVTLCLEREYESWSCALRASPPAVPGGGSVVFEEVQPGRYAIKAFHDSDGDGALDRDLFGAPSEDYGFSNDARGSFGPPDFDEAAVTVGEEAATFRLRVR